MARRVGWYFVFVGLVLLAIAFVLAMGEQSSGRMLLIGFGGLAVGAWLIVRSVGSATIAAPPPSAPPAAAQAKQGPKAPGPPKPAPAAPARARGMSRLFQPRSKSRT
jgi:hypothetical protein